MTQKKSTGKYPDKSVTKSYGRGRARPGLGFFLGAFLYSILFVAVRSAGTPLWGFLAFLVIPGLIMLVVGPGGTNGERYGGNFKAAFWAMGIYTAIGLIRAASAVQSGETGQMFLVGCFVTFMYGIFAGLIALGLSLLRTKLTEGRGFVHGEAGR